MVFEMARCNTYYKDNQVSPLSTFIAKLTQLAQFDKISDTRQCTKLVIF